MKIMSAFKMIRKLPEAFKPVRQELLNDILNAFFDPTIEYENLIREAKFFNETTKLFTPSSNKKQQVIRRDPKK